MAITAVSRMGGIGKTALAQQYVRTAKEQYPGGRWYFKVKEQNLATLLVSAVKTKFDWQLPEGITDSAAQAKWCYDRWCETFPGPRLLLLDDVQTYGDVKDCLPVDQTSLRVLMTSRQRFGRPVDRLDLGVLPLDEAMALLTTLINDGERVKTQQADAEKLCEWVGRLPLGIELLGRYLEEDPVSFGELLGELEEARLKAIALQDLPEEMAYEYSIQAAFELSWQTLDPEAQTLMGVLATFAQAPIRLELIQAALPDWNKQALRKSLNKVLVKRNLLQGDNDGSYQLHQLIREFTVVKLETELSDQTSTLQKGVAVAVTNFASAIEPLVRKYDLPKVGLGVPHMALVATGLNHVLADDDNPGWVFTGLARFYQSQSLWPEAERWYKGRLEMTEERFGSDHPSTATSLNNLAGLYESMGRYSEAEPLYARSLEISEAQLGPDHPDTATSLNNLAGLYESMGRYSEAEPLYARSLEISEAQLGPDHPSTATSLNNLAKLYRAMERYVEAEKLYTRGLKIIETQLGSNHPSMAIGLNDLAFLYTFTERNIEAEPLYARALDIGQKVLGEKHPFTQVFRRNFVSLLQKVIETNQIQQLSDHPLTQSILKNLLSNNSE